MVAVIVELVAAAVVLGSLYYCWRAEAKARTAAVAEVARLERERDLLRVTVHAQDELITGWRRAATSWRATAVKLLHDLNPEAAAVAKQAIAVAETSALVKRVEATSRAGEEAQG